MIRADEMTNPTTLAASPLRVAGRAGALKALTVIWTAFKVRRERQALSRLSDHELADIGLTREQAWDEAARSFWDLPKSRW